MFIFLLFHLGKFILCLLIQFIEVCLPVKGDLGRIKSTVLLIPY